VEPGFGEPLICVLCNSGYWQVPVDPESRDKTTFTCHSGLFRFLRMPFGLTNAPATFQRALDIILARIKFDVALVYLDDVIVYSPTFDMHLEHLDTVLGLLKKANVSLKLKKCSFAKNEVQYLGHLIRPGRLQMLKAKVDTVRQQRPPKTKTQVRAFLGLTSMYRRLVPHFAKIAKPLTELTKENVSDRLPELTPVELQAFETLKFKLTNPPTLVLPRFDQEFILDTDASKEQVGCVLQQKDQKGYLKPIG
jgi:hypothetical protein